MSKQEELRDSIFNILVPFDRTPVNEMVKQILKACKDMDMAFVDRDAELPEIPDFQYDAEDVRLWLKRGAINYSKMLGSWQKVEEIKV